MMIHNEPKIFYLCDRQRCSNCSYPTCKHTADIAHAINFKGQDPMIRVNNRDFWEIENKTSKT